MKFWRELGRGLVLAVVILSAIDLARALQDLSPCWWLGPAPPLLSVGLRVGLIVLLGAHLIRPAGPYRRVATVGVVLGALIIAVRDIATFYALSSRGQIDAGSVPLSLAVALSLLIVVLSVLRAPSDSRPGPGAAAFAGLVLVAFAFGQMLTFGHTSYARRADAVVVFGARVYADGTASLALADRLRTGCELVLSGYAPILFVSGGPGDGATHEAVAMKRMATECGVDEAAIVVDREGLGTWETARNFARRFDGDSVLAVSHGYHLPRIKIAFDRAGVEAYTVPAHETRTLAALPYYMAREVAAFWLYYLAPAGTNPPS